MFIRRLNSISASFNADLNDLLSWDSVSDPSVAQTVATIIGDVRSRGDAAVIEYTNRLDRRDLKNIDELKISSDDLARALASISAAELDALNVAAKRVQDYHEHQRQESWQFSESDGTVLGQKITPMDRV
jgi:histidinol dehydrogenase